MQESNYNSSVCYSYTDVSSHNRSYSKKYFINNKTLVEKNHITKFPVEYNKGYVFSINFFGNKIMSKHFISYDTPEEDDILLSTYMGLGWYNIVQFPLFESWKTTGNLSLLSDQEKKRIGSFYHQCMQKILFRRGQKSRGQEKQFLNKTHLIALYPFWKTQYPDANFFFD